MRIYELSEIQYYEYVVEQAVAVVNASGYTLDNTTANNHMKHKNVVVNETIDLMDRVFDCIAFILAHKRSDKELEDAFIELFKTRKNYGLIVDTLMDIADKSVNGELAPLVKPITVH